MTVSELQALEARYAMPTYPRAPVEFVRGEGTRLWDSDGREYLDFFAGLVLNVPGERMLRLLPPLIIDEADVDQALELLSSALAGSDTSAV